MQSESCMIIDYHYVSRDCFKYCSNNEDFACNINKKAETKYIEYSFYEDGVLIEKLFQSDRILYLPLCFYDCPRNLRTKKPYG